MGGCLQGSLLLTQFKRNECQDLLSACNGTHSVQTGPQCILLSEREGRGITTCVNSKRKISLGGSNLQYCITHDSEPYMLPAELLGPLSKF